MLRRYFPEREREREKREEGEEEEREVDGYLEWKEWRTCQEVTLREYIVGLGRD